MKNRIALAALVALGCLACFPKTEQTTIVGTNIFPSSNPSASPSPLCPITSIDLGSAGDDHTLAPGDTVGLVISIIGPSGEYQRTDSCLTNVTPTYTIVTSNGVPCQVLGGGYNASVHAPDTVTIGATCTATASVGPHSSSTAFTIQ